MTKRFCVFYISNKFYPSKQLLKLGSLVLIFPFLLIQANLYASIDLKALIEQEKLLAGQIGWEGFDPASIPSLIFDGVNSYLVNHPAPPDDFKDNNKTAGIYIFTGRHPEIRANTAVEISGVKTACIDLDISKSPNVSEIAALLIHEKFHVYQFANHPEWWGIANEMALFEYPMEDPKLLMFTYLEIQALSNACNAKTAGDAECWAKRAVEVRSMRYASLNEACIAYERGIELVEGTAQYVQMKALGSSIEKFMNDEMLKPDKVRARSYATGAMICLLLDRFHPTWKEELSPKNANYLDVILKNTVLQSTSPCTFDQDYMNRQETAANRAVDEYLLKKLKALDDFLGKPGFKIVIDCGNSPLMPAGFDPMNMEKVSQNELLHKRWLKLTNNTATVEILNIESLSQGLGNHPMFNGVKQVIITGLNALPDVKKTEGKIEFKTENISAEIGHADMEIKDNTLLIHLK